MKAGSHSFGKGSTCSVAVAAVVGQMATRESQLFAASSYSAGMDSNQLPVPAKAAGKRWAAAAMAAGTRWFVLAMAAGIKWAELAGNPSALIAFVMAEKRRMVDALAAAAPATRKGLVGSSVGRLSSAAS